MAAPICSDYETTGRSITIARKRVWEERHLEVDGVNAHYLEAGAGETVLLVHGGGLQSTAELNYGAAIGPLSEVFHVVAVDLPGYGFTAPRGTQDYTPTSHGIFLIQFLKKLGVKAYLVGNSRGGWLVQYVAHEAPELVKKIVIINSMGATKAVTEKEWASIAPIEGVDEYPTLEGLRAGMLDFYYNKSFVTEERVKLAYDVCVRNYEYGKARQATRGRGADGRNRDQLYRGRHISESAGQLRVPVLLTWSRENYGATPVDAALFLNRLTKDFVHELHVFTNSGHHVQTEHAKRWCEVVISFLRSK